LAGRIPQSLRDPQTLHDKYLCVQATLDANIFLALLPVLVNGTVLFNEGLLVPCPKCVLPHVDENYKCVPPVTTGFVDREAAKECYQEAVVSAKVMTLFTARRIKALSPLVKIKLPREELKAMKAGMVPVLKNVVTLALESLHLRTLIHGGEFSDPLLQARVKDCTGASLKSAEAKLLVHARLFLHCSRSTISQ
jgi:hypothetical protein